MGGEKDSKDTEDHYYVENCSRTTYTFSFVAFVIFTLFWHYISFPNENDGKLTSGIEAYETFYKETKSVYALGATFFGVFIGLLISFLSEYFTS